ncbi:MAG TPA: 30S ribosomal protein S9 [Candidatus Paceibacterota bacterium]|nr:30S ribosomal protein S9 [Candidatus Paceibacterota bacterium]
MIAQKEKIIVTSGKRKSCVAKAKISPGNGKITINNLPSNLLYKFHQMAIDEPLMIAKNILKNIEYDIEITVTGGGRESQIEAARLALAKALVQKTKSEPLKKAFLKYDKQLLIADVRRKEVYKPGDSKARSRRQKSYR